MDGRKKKVLIVLCVAGVIFAWRVIAVVTKYMPSGAQAGVPSVETAPEPTELAAKAAAKARERETAGLMKSQEQAARQPWGRDPFANIVSETRGATPAPSKYPTVAQAPTAPRLNFTGVAKVDDGWWAIVSGQFVRIGDVVETDFRVSEITKRSITFQSRGWSLHYELGKDAPLVQLVSEEP